MRPKGSLAALRFWALNSNWKIILFKTKTLQGVWKISYVPHDISINDGLHVAQVP